MSLAATRPFDADLTAEADAPTPEGEAVQRSRPDAELAFYQDYAWCLNPFPTVRETVAHLGDEMARLQQPREAWQTDEGMTNVFLLSCALLHAAEEYLRGKTFRLPGSASGALVARGVRWATETLGAVQRPRARARARRWRDACLAGLDAFLPLLIAGETPDPTALAAAGDGLARLVRSPLPSDLQTEPIYFPSAFRRLDLTPFDLLALGRRFTARFPDRARPLLVVGLRTAGSYFAPLLRAFFKAEGYEAVDSLTVHPDKGPGSAEWAGLVRGARGGGAAVILDDPPYTGDTYVRAVDMARKAGFAPDRVVVLAPAPPAARRDWGAFLERCGTVVLSLEPDEWHKHRLLEPKTVEARLADYFQGRRYSGVRVTAGPAPDGFNAQLRDCSDDPRRARLKRVYEVRLRTPQGGEETRYVLAKSVGWGWLGYHAFLAGRRLAGFVPPVLGLRDGVLYSEWYPQSPLTPVPLAETNGGEGAADEDREQWIRTTASYVAARVRHLSLGTNPMPGVGLHRHHDGFRLLEKVFSRAYGRFVTAQLMRPRVRHRLANQACPCPTLIDGKMERSEWIAGPHGLLKTDYEHHGLGKNELNAIDPAYDLADTILQLALTFEEEDRLIHQYIGESGDAGVEGRLFLNKVLAGTWSMASAVNALFRQPHLDHRRQELNRRYNNALHFLTVHAARYCGGLCRPPKAPSWRAPVVVLDIDGVVDRRLLGFPCTTAAGIQALSLLHAHEHAIALNTARSVAEVQEYCRAYGLVGGVAEYGSYVWDAVSRSGRPTVSGESLRQLAEARKALEQIPSVFLDDRYQFSIRAYTYEDEAATLGRLPIPAPLRSLLSPSAGEKATAPLPALLVQPLLAALKLDRLCVRHTTIDTTITAAEVDKGSGLSALLSHAGLPAAETLVVGDSEPDLAMFRVATRCFAPAHIPCARLARLLGCRIAREPYQRGLLSIVRSLVHPDGRRCRRCSSCEGVPAKPADLFHDLLRAADWDRSTAFRRALLDPMAYRIFVR